MQKVLSYFSAFLFFNQDILMNMMSKYYSFSCMCRGNLSRGENVGSAYVIFKTFKYTSKIYF